MDLWVYDLLTIQLLLTYLIYINKISVLINGGISY